MDQELWTREHNKYGDADWTHKPSIFAEQVVGYFPKAGRVLDLGAGHGQDSAFFLSRGYQVVAADVSDAAMASLQELKSSHPDAVRLELLQRDVIEGLPYPDGSFQAVYAQLSLHYFDRETTREVFEELHRVLSPGGVLAVMVNNVADPEYGQGQKLEDDYYVLDGKLKRFFSPESIAGFAEGFGTILADAEGETYKDAVKGVHHLVRYVGRRL